MTLSKYPLFQTLEEISHYTQTNCMGLCTLPLKYEVPSKANKSI